MSGVVKKWLNRKKKEPWKVLSVCFHMSGEGKQPKSGGGGQKQNGLALAGVNIYFKGSYIMPIGPKYCNYVWGAGDGGSVLTHTGEVVIGVGFAHAHTSLILLSSCNFSLCC